MHTINTMTIEDQITAQNIAIEATQNRKQILQRAIVELLVDRSENEQRAIFNY